MQQLRPTWIAFGWFIAIAATGLAVLALASFGVIGEVPDEGGVWIAAAILFGFLVGGFFTGARTGTAPLLHGLGIGLFSVVAWLLANLLIGEPIGAAAWTSIPTASAAALLLLQAVAAIVGARAGVRLTHTAPAGPADTGEAPSAERRR